MIIQVKDKSKRVVQEKVYKYPEPCHSDNITVAPNKT